MNIRKITYSESRKLTTGVRFESKLVSISAEAELKEGDNEQSALLYVKNFVKSELKKELENKS